MKTTKRSTPARSKGLGSKPRQRPLVLIVDDVADNRDIYADFLRFAGYDVIEATDGYEAVKRATKELPDVVLMDLSLPGMDGWDATRKIKAAESTKHIKVIAVTGHALEGTAKGARDAGCDGFLAKPCLPETLEAEVKRMLESARGKSKTTSRAKTV